MSSSTTDKEAYKIEHLKGTDNYLAWQTKMYDILSDAGLIDYAIGRRLRPEADAESWVANDRRALTMIRLCVTDSILIHIRRAQSSAEAWNTLAKRFEPKGVSAVIATRRELFSAKYEEGTDISDFINKMLKYQDTLTTLAHPLPEDEFSLLILTALGESWDSFISTLKDSELGDSDTIISRILEVKMRRSTTSEETALTAKFSGKKKQKY